MGYKLVTKNKNKYSLAKWYFSISDVKIPVEKLKSARVLGL
jgi:hypothetical protein